MLSSFARLLLTSTSVAPILISFAFVYAFDGRWGLVCAIIAVCLALVFLCVFVIEQARKTLEQFSFSAKSVEAADRENIGFLFLYLLPLFTANLDALNWSVWAAAVVMFAWIVATGYSYHFNPLLNFLGWHFFRVVADEGVSYVLITRREIRSALDDAHVVQLTEYMILDTHSKQ